MVSFHHIVLTSSLDYLLFRFLQNILIIEAVPQSVFPKKGKRIIESIDAYFNRSRRRSYVEITQNKKKNGIDLRQWQPVPLGTVGRACPNFLNATSEI